ncbi:ParB/RepB/Spo0J family partition protein [Actinoallomurus soli]|uniref:ParB/RepB/Spo0J family partition protein n=1 Tax=Actinoallomurus soli TaxID=2952535 RepID=UPI002092B065|nr:ParB/RepB/Spo0J family partition protein [Actinoallomurus soli]MCO5973230.1 ParB/RepB/Spo0J family partition protein [Actinoallomurus soli]
MVLFNRVENINLDRLVIGAQQARTRDVEQDIGELVDSIRVHGQLEPIIIAPLEDRAGYYEILAGQRRWLAMRRLGATEIAAAIIEERPDKDVASALSISENLIRRDLNTLDLIDACTRLYHKYGSIKAVAERFGLPYGRVRRYVKFDRLRPALKELVRSGDIDLRAALRIEDHYGAKKVDDAQLRRIAAAVAEMSNAQQADYFKTRAAETTSSAEDERPAGDGHRPGSVKQIIVTLSIADLELLRAWARAKNLTQDRAGARIISAFLQQAMAMPNSLYRDGGGDVRLPAAPSAGR